MPERKERAQIMPNAKTGYRGPVIFIVHSPLAHIIRAEEREIHLKRMRQLISFANKHKIPVIYGARDIAMDRDAELKEIDGLLKKSKTLAAVVELPEAGNLEPAPVWRKQIAKAMTMLEMKPTEFIIGGFYRESCITRALQVLKSLFPRAKLVELKGDFNWSMGADKRSLEKMRFKDSIREKVRILSVSAAEKVFKKAKPRHTLLVKRYGVERRPLRKALHNAPTRIFIATPNGIAVKQVDNKRKKEKRFQRRK